MSFTQYADVYFTQLKNNFVREAVYRTNFLMALVTDLVWMAVEISLFTVIYANTPTIAGWRREETYFFLGIFFASDALFTVFFQRNFWNFSDLVNKGELDIVLTKPIHPLFIALTRWMNLTAIFNVATGLIVASYYAGAAGFEGGTRWLIVVFWLGVGCLSALVLRFAFSIWVFWTDRGWALSRMYYQFFAFATKPDLIYPKMIRYLILTALPFAFIGSVPARVALQRIDAQEILQVVGVIAAFVVFDLFWWRRGLRRYQSASS